MTDKEKLKAAQDRFNKRHPGLTKKRDHDRYLKRRGDEVKEEREIIKKEITTTKKYIKKVWGRETPLKKLNYQEIKKIGDELGMNIFNVKSFQDRYKKNKFKSYTRVCKYCKEYYDGQAKIKSHTRNLGVCPSCKKKDYKDRVE